MINSRYTDDLKQISEEEYYQSTYSMFNKQQINCIGYDQLVFVANYPTSNNMINSQNLESKAYPIHFNALDDMETESELSDEDADVIKKLNHEKIKLPANSEFLNTSDQKNNIYTLIDDNQEVQDQESKIQHQNLTNIIKHNTQNELQENKDSKLESFHQDFKLYKKKSQIQKNEQNQQEEEGQNLTQYQKKKILIQQLKEANILLDWDSYKKQNVLYEYSNPQGGASRRKKGKYSEIDIIDLPNPHFETNGAVNSSQAAATREKERESKRQKQNSKLSSNPNQQKRKSINFSSDDTDVVENIKTKSSLKYIQEEEGPIIEAIEVEQDELLRRQKELKQNLFKVGRCTIPCNKTLVSSQVQAIIPQIRPIEEVKKTWVLQDLDQLLQFKNSEKYNQLEMYMNQTFGVRKPEEVFNILKLNNYDLKQCIDYCIYQRDFLSDVFKYRDQERKKKLNNKRKLEKRDYI
ncbi:hypothetical protein ABPG72_007864 [Tetrahymena utriculariae]